MNVSIRHNQAQARSTQQGNILPTSYCGCLHFILTKCTGEGKCSTDYIFLDFFFFNDVRWGGFCCDSGVRVLHQAIKTNIYEQNINSWLVKCSWNSSQSRSKVRHFFYHVSQTGEERYRRNHLECYKKKNTEHPDRVFLWKPPRWVLGHLTSLKKKK